ncbi:alginate lyase domain-containing protein [Moniliophthora roreri MCA 2997]|uniref:Alginate lyase domain-containing protein n=1 Tax=Moniliophthora roreri (strain MCA 2997) TaxID=1381753 RepID=V2XGV8_MONRO|nr:alginate lyase domain-containing protein [Moniliophthora roreri MCA 2997]
MLFHLFLLVFTTLFQHANAAASYISDFVDPDFILSREFAIHTYPAEVSIVKWARQFSLKGPWSVMDKPVLPPSGNKHDYMSWSPYSWPNCSSVGNTTVLSDEEVWKRCPYEIRDGEFNPDGRIVSDAGAFDDLSNAVLYNAISAIITGGNTNLFSRNVAAYLKRWFLDPKTKMNPHLTYAQMQRGPNGQVGRHTGVLDMKGFSKIASGILILRKSNNTDYTSEIDEGMIVWCKEYIQWLDTNPTAHLERIALNNHGTFFYVQMTSLKLIINDREGAIQAIETFYANQFLGQIEENGEQSIARIAKYLDPNTDAWTRTTFKNGTIQKALDFSLTLDAKRSNETENAGDLWPCIAAIGSVFGDPEGRYEAYLRKVNPEYASEPHFFWNQPFIGGPTPTSAAERARMTRRINGTKSRFEMGSRWVIFGLDLMMVVLSA